MRKSSFISGPPMGFKPPKASGSESPSASAASPKGDSGRLSVGSASVRGSAREIVYPTPSGRTQDELLNVRMSKRTEIDYHQPAAVVASTKAGSAPKLRYDEEGNLIQTATVVLAKSALPADQPSSAGVVGSSALATIPNGNAEDIVEATEEVEVEVEAGEIVSRLPVSPLGKLYFQVEAEGATKHESVGIIIIDVEAKAVQMFDRLGRQHGNREDPGYPVKQDEFEAAAAGTTMRVGMKSVLIVTALKEEVFRSGEFFLRSEHQARKKDEKKKAKADAEAAAASKLAKPRMSFGGGFGALMLRKRPTEGSTGFTVPVAGRPKTPGATWDYKSLHDPDRENAMVLFRADYKRDANGQQIVSVVVDPVVGDKLRPHQRIGVKFLFDCVTGERMPGYFGCILADEMGLGKTVQTVATVYTCLKQGKFGRPVSRKCLVVAPSSLVRNWCNEFDKWLGVGVVKYFAISESTPKGDRILSRFESEGDVLVISYDQLRKYIDRISKITAVDLCVCDEGHRLKNAEIKTTKAVDMLPTRRRIILSGTPIQNDLTEFHAMVGFVNPGILGNRDLFGRVFEEPIMKGRDPECPDSLKDLGSDRAHYLANLTQMFILRRTQTINEKYLPAKVDCTVFVRLGDEQRAAYQRVSDLAAGDKGLSSTPLVLISALKKLCNHMDLLVDAVKTSQASAATSGRPSLPSAVLPKSYKIGQLDFSFGSKLAFVSLMLDELTTNGDRDKLVIVSNYTQTLDIIARLCVSKKVSFFQLDGNTPIKKRQELVDLFNIPMAQEIVFLLSSKAGGVGLNLVGANRLILFDPDWNPANDAQAMGRVWRDGQKKKVFIYRLLSTGTIEEKVYQRQVSKQGLSANVVDMQDDSKQHFTLDEMKALFAFRPDTKCDTHDLLGCKCLIEAAAVAAGTFRKVGAVPSGPRMDELKSWQHVSNIKGFSLDKVMMRIAGKNEKLVSFLFANERDAKKFEELQLERPFVSDEGKITVSSSQIEGGKGGDEDDIELDIVDGSSSSSSSDGEDAKATKPTKGKSGKQPAANPATTKEVAAKSTSGGQKSVLVTPVASAAPKPAPKPKSVPASKAVPASKPSPKPKKGAAKKRGRDSSDDDADGDFINDNDDDDDSASAAESEGEASASSSSSSSSENDNAKSESDSSPPRRSARLEAIRQRHKEATKAQKNASDKGTSSSSSDSSDDEDDAPKSKKKAQEANKKKSKKESKQQKKDKKSKAGKEVRSLLKAQSIPASKPAKSEVVFLDDDD